MTRRMSVVLGCALVALGLGVAGQGVARDEDPSAAVIEGLVSTLPGGVVSIKADPTLSNGRLVLRVVAFNKGAAPVTLNAADIKLYTSANQPVALLTLDQLVAEVSNPAPARPVGSATGYGGQALATGADGRLDVSGFSGPIRPRWTL